MAGFRAISQGLHVGYRKGTRKRAWLVRLFTKGKYVWRTLGQVDDVLDADGKEVLNWAQAQEASQAFDKDLKVSQGVIRKPLTVEKASERYLTWSCKMWAMAKTTRPTQMTLGTPKTCPVIQV